MSIKNILSDMVKFLTSNKAIISKSEVAAIDETSFELKLKTKG